MDYLNLNSELQNLDEYSKIGINTLGKFNTLIRTIIKLEENFSLKCEKLLEEFIIEVKKEITSTSVKETFIQFTNLFESYFNQRKLSANRIEKEVIAQLEDFSSSHLKVTAKTLGDFQNLINDVEENKNKLEAIKSNYFESWKEVDEQEEKFQKTKEKTNIKEDEIQKIESNLNKAKSKADNGTLNYKSAIDKMNKYLEKEEKKYAGIRGNFILNEEQKLIFIQMQLTKLQQIIHDDIDNQNQLNERFKKYIDKINIRRDIKLILTRFDYLTTKKMRFTQENFMDYEILTKNNKEENINQTSSFENMFKFIISNDELLNEQKERRALICQVDINRFQKDDFIFIESDEKYSPIVDKLINGKESISNDELDSLMAVLNKKKDASRKIIESLFFLYQTKISLYVQNLGNLHHLANIFILLINNSLTNKEIFELNFLIIYMAEMTIYSNQENIFNRCYLSKLLSKNKIFENKDFWNELIDIRIKVILNIEIKNEIKRREDLNKLEVKNIYLEIKSIFNFKTKENKKIENEILYKQLEQEKLPFIAANVIEDFIPHFSNFNQEISTSIELVNELCLKYKINSEYVKYFNALLNSNTYSVRNKGAFLEDIERKVDYQSLYFNENFCNDKIYIEDEIKLIGSSLKFIPVQDIWKIMLLNKKFKSTFSKIIYKNILLKYHDMSFETRLKIWEILLDYNETKKKVNYKEVLQSYSNSPNIPSRDIIELDVSRTLFESDTANNRQKILNILRAITVTPIDSAIQYCQGMNYMAVFILAMANYDEEKAYYMFLSLLQSTDYGQLFIDDLKLLKRNFYVFDRLLYIFMPELFFYLKNNKINVSYFVSPWFITLFTNTYPNIKEKKNPKVLLRIWELFLFNGWGSIMKIGISLIKHFEDKLLTFTFEELLQYIINDIVKSGFFQNENFDKLMFITVNINIEDELLNNLEKEFEFKNSLKEISEKK